MKRRSFLASMLAAPLALLGWRRSELKPRTATEAYRLAEGQDQPDGSHETHLLEHALMEAELHPATVREIVMGQEFYDLVQRQMWAVAGGRQWRSFGAEFELKNYAGHPVRIAGPGHTGWLICRFPGRGMLPACTGTWDFS